jgi:hypothetical protein
MEVIAGDKCSMYFAIERLYDLVPTKCKILEEGTRFRVRTSRFRILAALDQL